MNVCVQVGDSANFDGAKKFVWAHLAHTPRAAATHSRLDLTCSNECGALFGQMVADAGVLGYDACIGCPRHICHGSLDALNALLRNVTENVTVLEDISPEFAGVLQPVIEALSREVYDVIAVTHDKFVDYYVFALAKLIQPHIVRMFDMTTRYTMEAPPASARNQAYPVDALITPSLFVALHPHVTATRVPSYLFPGAVDSAKFDAGSNLERVGPHHTLPIPIGYIGGRYRQHLCAMSTSPSHTSNQSGRSDWCSADSPIVFGYVARVSLEKGVALFVRAAAVVAAVLPNARFLIVGGTGWGEEPYLHALISVMENYRVRDKVCFSL